MTSKEIMSKIEEKDQKKLKLLGMRKTKKLMKYSGELYNNLCISCKSQVISNPKFDNYCSKCEIEVKKIEEKINRLE